MYEVLYRYLIRYKEIDLPGVGCISLARQPAVAEFANHSFLAPAYDFEFHRSDEVPPEKLFSWMASHLSITEQEAVIRFNEFLYDLNRKLKEGKHIHWKGVGTLQKEFSGNIKFEAEKKDFPWHREIVAEKVTRENAEHLMLVGEREKTSSEMRGILQGRLPIAASHWWVWPLALVIASLLLLGWHFSENNGQGSTGNRQVHQPAEAPSGFSLSP